MAQTSILSFFSSRNSNESLETKKQNLSEVQTKRKIESLQSEENGKKTKMKHEKQPLTEQNKVVESVEKEKSPKVANELPVIKIPLRKTARKQMKSLKTSVQEANKVSKVTENVKQSEDAIKSETNDSPDADVDMKGASEANEHSPLKSSVEESDSKKRKSEQDSDEEDNEILQTVKKKCKKNVISDSPDKDCNNAVEEAIESSSEISNNTVETGHVKPIDTEKDTSHVACDAKNDLSSDKSSKTKKNSPESHASTSIHSFFNPQQKKSDVTPLSSDKVENVKSVKSNDAKMYNPAQHNYHPIDDACWKRDEKVPYLALARTFEEIEKITARLKMIEILANFFRSVIVLTPDDLLHSVYLCLNRIAPEYEGVEMGVGETHLMKAVAQATGRTVEKIKAEVADKGDLGLVAESSRGNQRVMFAFPKLTVASVFEKFKDIAQMTGNSAASKKIDKIQALFVACRHCEARYIIRSLSGKLRIGLAEQSVLSALARATVLTPPNQIYPPSQVCVRMSTDLLKETLDDQTLILKTTYSECPNYNLIIPVLLKEGISGLPKHCHLTPGVPLKPMLAHPTKGIDEVLQRFDSNSFTCEFKYDGERAQIHHTDTGEIKIYSRNQEDNTTKYPDVISRLPNAFKADVKSFILDSETVAWDKETKQILPFQVLSTRKRKDAVGSDIKVQVCIVAFDLLYLNGESLIKKPLKERRELLKEFFVEVPDEFMFARSLDCNTVEAVQEFLDESIKGKCEGLMLKSLEVNATYEIAKRSHSWLKLKKDYLSGTGDTFDLVVLGGWYGKGKRTGSYGGFLLGCYDDETEEYQTICKIGTGFKDDDLETHTKFFKSHTINAAKSYFRYDSSLEPDVWFEPVQVWEVKCADLSISPVHKAAIGKVDPEKGISLRFPRFLRIRDDKKAEDATTASQVAHMYSSQEQVQNSNSNSTIDEEDFY